LKYFSVIMETPSTLDHAELERQLELRDSSIASLRRMLEQKEELLMATRDKLFGSERERTEMEDALLSLTKESDLSGGLEAEEEEVVDSFVASSSRAAQMEAENSDLRVRMATLASKVQEFCNQFKNEANFNALEAVQRLEVSVGPANSILVPKQLTDETVIHLQIKMELEHERRVRVLAALDDSEKRNVCLKRDVENKSREFEAVEKRLSNMKDKYELKIKQVEQENRRLETLLKVKETQIGESESMAKEISLRAEEFEELFNGQSCSVKALQSNLMVASNENKAMVKEMEMLNQMFNAMEKHYATYKSTQEDPEETQPKDSEGRDIVVQDVLTAVAKTEEEGINLEESCFKEVVTKNGIRMVLSVSKTFMKLKDLILEKNTLEDQVEKMKAINTHLCSRVNRHEAKLYNITDEMNKTWNFVSTLKQQHRQLHESEQILRAELSEKRQILAKIREELEYSRESWNIVKKKNADSEREWHALRDEFADRRKLITSYHLSSSGGVSSAESGFSTETEPENDIEDDEGEVASVDVMTASTLTIKNEELEELEPVPEEPEVAVIELATMEDQSIVIFVPPLDLLAQVPDDLMPPLFPKAEDDNYSEIYHNLITSTARSAALANRLAEMTRTNGSDEEEDYEPHTEDDSIEQGATSPDIESEIASEVGSENGQDKEIESDDEEEELEDLGLSPEAIEEALAASGRNFEDDSDGDDDDTTSTSAVEDSEDSEGAGEALAIFQSTPLVGLPIPTPPPHPTFSLLPPPATVTVRPTYNFANIDSADSSDADEDNAANEEASENATAVTRFLIKNLPKQLAKLRHDKAELEDKICDLEALISNQNVSMSEMERRVDVYKKDADTARNLHQVIHRNFN
jgi:hypothetical protein